MKLACCSLAALCLLGCARTRVETNIRPDLVGTKYARITGYMATRGAAPGGRSTEETPGDIGHDAIRDEATLMKLTPSETCAEVVIRTDRAHDEPIEQLVPTFEFDGKAQKAIIEDEIVTVRDYSYMGRVETLAVEGVAANTYLGMSMTEPGEQVFRVVERRGLVCAPVGGGAKEIALDLTHPYWNVAEYHYHLVFAWKVGG
jgi:hypothetical protein